jgi:hypothetical protein
MSATSMTKAILLSFDIEEFDIPEEYNQRLTDEEKFEISRQGFDALLELLDRLQIRSTLFVTANFALHYPALIKFAASKHEIASHGFYHSSFDLADLEKSKKVLEQISDSAVTGFRMARLQKIDENAIATAGYLYNSSMNPTYLPGRYNNFFKKRIAHYAEGMSSRRLLSVPVSVTPLIRFPLFWLSFKNFPLPLIKLASRLTLEHDRYLSLYFHPWEFVDLSVFHLPGYIKKHSGQPMLKRLERYLIWLHRQGEFISFSEFMSCFHSFTASSL